MNNKKILLVDDESDLIYGMKIQLEASGFEVITANDGQEGLNKARKERPDLIVLDIMLPKIDGYKVCRMVKFDEKYKAIRVIIYTGRAQPADEKLAFEVGADAYLTKPFDPKKLLAKIRELLQ